MPPDHRRSERVAEAIREELANALAAGFKDPRISRLTTITGVEITRDLRHATVFVSVMGDDAERKLTLEGLTSAGHMMRGQVTRALRLRVAPELAFKYDDSLQRGARIELLLAEIREQGGLGPVDPAPTAPPEAHGAAAADEDADGDERA